MIKAVLLMVLCFASISQATEVGFKHGNEKTSILAQGDIMVVCNDSFQGGTQFGNFHCERELLAPSEFDYFQGPKDVPADEVTLTAIRADKSVKSKSLGYDMHKMQSSKQFNLWISTLFQRPLLKAGHNQVTYVMKYKGKVSHSGQFEVTVKDGGTKICNRRGYYTSTVASDCWGASGRFCDQFFYENNYCL
ncbi:MAG: hypothetical protein ACXVCY_13990 [Pseudobdellovibrionaceae bacterium]